jgi:serine protease inhibitor ecotin
VEAILLAAAIAAAAAVAAIQAVAIQVAEVHPDRALPQAAATVAAEGVKLTQFIEIKLLKFELHVDNEKNKNLHSSGVAFPDCRLCGRSDCIGCL